jgi:hypothetical protein
MKSQKMEPRTVLATLRAEEMSGDYCRPLVARLFASQADISQCKTIRCC